MMVEKDARDLFKAGEKQLGTDEDTFIRIFSTRSRAHMAALSVCYHHMYGNSLKKVHKSVCSILKVSFCFFVSVTAGKDEESKCETFKRFRISITIHEGYI